MGRGRFGIQPGFARAIRLFVALAFVGFAAVAIAGCGTHVVGTNDAAIDYEIRQAPAAHAKRSVASAATELIHERLAAGQLATDIDATSDTGVRIVVDETLAESVDELVRWRGGIAIYKLDPAYSFVPHDLTGLTAKVSSSGAPERYFSGSPDAITRALNAAPPPAGHTILVDAEAGEWRTRSAIDPPLVDLRDEHDVDLDHGNVVRVRLSPAALQALAPFTNDPTPIAIARGRTLLAIRPLASIVVDHAGFKSIDLTFGADLYSYVRAHRARALLASPTLPPIARTNAARLPTRWPLAIACIALPMLLSFAWIFFVRRFDRARPEPLWLVMATFLLGGLSCIPAGLMEWLLMSASPYLNPSLMTFGGQLFAVPIAFVVFTIVIGMSEEVSKFFGAWTLAWHRREFDEPVDGIVYGAASALGFAAVENVKYFAEGRLAATLIVARTVTSIPAHTFFGAIWGYALGRKLVDRRVNVAWYVVFAAVMHGAFDTFLSFEKLASLALFLNLLLAILFIHYLRKALRYGVVSPDEDDLQPLSANRVLYRVGSPLIFALSVIGLNVFAIALFGLGGYLDYAHHRVDAVFLVTSSVVLIAIGLSAWGVSAAIPLDAAVDENGITFAGTTRRWNDVTAIDILGRRSRATLVVRSEEGDLSIGPAPETTMGSLATMMQTQMIARGFRNIPAPTAVVGNRSAI